MNTKILFHYLLFQYYHKYQWFELQNQNPSSNIGIGWANNYDTIGVWQGSTSPCVGSVDGSCNTQQIVQYAATHPGTYFSAAYYCANVTIDDYTGWYLPAQCEMTDYDSQCAGVQNIQSNLVDLNIPNLNIYSAIYQSSTELAPPNAFGYIFGWGFVGQNYLQTNKQSAPIYSASLRCARQFT